MRKREPEIQSPPPAASAAVHDLRQRFRRWYVAEHPERMRLRLLHLTPISDGWETDVSAATVTYDDGGTRRRDALILRRYQGPDAADKAAREFHGLHNLTQAGFPVPQPDRLALDASLMGQPALTMERIAGRSLAQALAASDAAHELWRLFCRLVVDLHALDWHPFVSDPAQHPADEAIIAWLAWARDVLAQSQVHAFDPAMDWLEQRVATVRCERLSVIHGDYHPNNVLLRDDGAAIVIDWTQIDVSDYRFDLAWTLLLVGTSGHPERRQLVLKEYERLLGHPVEHLAFFEVAACLKRLASFVLSLALGPAVLGMRPEALALMRRQLPHFQTVYALFQERTSGLSLPEVERLLADHSSSDHPPPHT